MKCRVKVRITPADKGVTLPASCVCEAPDFDLSKLWMWVRRRGQSEWLVKYPAWDTDDYGGVLFLFDDLFFRQKPGRYEAELRLNNCGCEVIELDYRCPCAPKVSGVLPLKPAGRVFPSRPKEICDVFDTLVGFKTELCGVLEKGVRSIPLCGDALAALCAYSGCCPVQLVVSDGVRTEIVEFTGCDGGTVVVNRGEGGTLQRRFPPGSTVTFEWTEANVKCAGEMCADLPELGPLQC